MRWQIRDNGIFWDASGSAHTDSIEMSGRGCSVVVRYGTDESGRLLLERRAVFPTLRLTPNVTEAAFLCDIPAESALSLDGAPEYAEGFFYDGLLTITSRCGALELRRTFFPDSHALGFWEILHITNVGHEPAAVTPCRNGAPKPCYGRGAYGIYKVETAVEDACPVVLAPGGHTTLRAHTSGGILHRPQLPCKGWQEELCARRTRIQALTEQAVLKTGNPILDTLYRLCQIHAGESIFDTLAGPLHSPGGCEYYAASWTNDQLEYAGPWFAFAGDPLAKEASVNAYRQYVPFMGPQYVPIPTSVIAQGQDIWEGAGDRGDAAMFLYGCSRYVLTCGDRTLVAEFAQPLLWCAEYCRRKTSAQGVVLSDSDELEGRFPCGHANLSTNCLCYAGLATAAAVVREAGLLTEAQRLEAQREALGRAIEAYFGAELNGLHTYRYYEGCDILRSWICWPLVAGFSDRAQDTVKALFSPALWSIEGMLCAQGDSTYWDRAALYAMRGALMHGQLEAVWPQLLGYAENRLLGERVPFPIEAWPEGGMRHLSAESALFCRILSEGLLGFEPLGTRCFSLTPRALPNTDRWQLSDIHICGTVFDITVTGSACFVRSEAKTWTLPINARSVLSW